MGQDTTKRLAPEVRRAEILAAAKRLLSQVGPSRFSLEGVAREAGVAASLPRHYFGGHADLLVAATADVIQEMQKALLTPDLSIPLSERLARSMDVLIADPWMLSVYLRADEIHPGLAAAARNARQRMAEFSFLRPWDEMTKHEQIHARGWVGYVEAVFSDWIERGMPDREAVLAIMLDAARRLGVKGAGEPDTSADSDRPVSVVSSRPDDPPAAKAAAKGVAPKKTIRQTA